MSDAIGLAFSHILFTWYLILIWCSCSPFYPWWWKSSFFPHVRQWNLNFFLMTFIGWKSFTFKRCSVFNSNCTIFKRKFYNFNVTDFFVYCCCSITLCLFGSLLEIILLETFVSAKLPKISRTGYCNIQFSILNSAMFFGKEYALEGKWSSFQIKYCFQWGSRQYWKKNVTTQET